MMQIDAKLEESVLRHFAAQASKVQPTLRNFMAECTVGDKSTEFYHGVVAGLAAAYQFAGTGKAGQDYIGVALATVSALILKLEQP